MAPSREAVRQRRGVAVGGDATATAVRVNRRQKLDELGARLSPDERTLLSPRIDQKLSWGEIAEVLSTEGSRVDTRTARKGYERLKARLAALMQADDE